jgi:hypothetical protein
MSSALLKRLSKTIREAALLSPDEEQEHESYRPSLARVVFTIMSLCALGDERDRKETRLAVMNPSAAGSLPELITKYRSWRISMRHAANLKQTYVTDAHALRDALDVLFTAAESLLPKAMEFRIVSHRTASEVDELPTVRSLIAHRDFVIVSTRRALQRNPELAKLTVAVPKAEHGKKVQGSAGAAASQQKVVTCFACGETGHYANACRKRNKESINTAAAAVPGDPPKFAKKFAECKRCGRSNHSAKDCYFLTRECSKCGKTGHAVSMCKSTSVGSGPKNAGKDGSKGTSLRKAQLARQARPPRSMRARRRTRALGRVHVPRVERLSPRPHSSQQQQQPPARPQQQPPAQP